MLDYLTPFIMTYIVWIVLPLLPDQPALAWAAADAICNEDQDDDDAPKAAVLVNCTTC